MCGGVGLYIALNICCHVAASEWQHFSHEDRRSQCTHASIKAYFVSGGTDFEKKIIIGNVI
jgi:hypothetical protein